MKKELRKKAKKATACLLAVSMMFGNGGFAAEVSGADIFTSGDTTMGAEDVFTDSPVQEVPEEAPAPENVTEAGEGEETEVEAVVEPEEVIDVEESAGEEETSDALAEENEMSQAAENETVLEETSEPESGEGIELFAEGSTELETDIMMLAAEAPEGTLQAQINDIQESGALTLDQDYTENIVIPQGKTVSLELNGYTISPDSATRIGTGEWNAVSVYGSLLLSDNTGSGAVANNGMANVRGINVAGTGSLTLYSGSIKGFSTGGNGGGLYVENGGLFVMEGGSICENTAEGNGGGFFAYDGSKVNLKAGSIRSNQASGCGGGAAVYHVSPGELSLASENLEISGNSAAENGGGLWMKGAGIVNISAGVYQGNTAGEAGGAFAFDGGVTLNITGMVEGNSAQRGGGFDIGAGSSVTIGEGAAIVRNQAAWAGGGVRFVSTKEAPGTLIMNGGRVGENSIVNDDEYTATYGAGLSLGNYINPVFSGTALIDRNTGAIFGGGMHIGAINTVMLEEECVIEENRTGGPRTGGGAGIHMSSGGTLIMNGGQIRLNAADNTNSTGGGIRQEQGVFEMNGGEISANAAANEGGGVYTGGTMKMNGGIVRENTSVGSGGGIRTGNMVMSGGTIESNTAKGASSGGGVCLVSKMIMTGGEIRENIGGNHGGGIYTWSGTLKLSGECRIIGNRASNGGGCSSFTGTIEMSGGIVSENYAGSNGGGVYVSSGTISGGTITNNTASGGGGIFKVNVSTELKITDQAFVMGNTASSGGGVYLNEGNLSVNGGVITGNISTYGGGIYIRQYGKEFIVSGGQIFDNLAKTYKGGQDLYVNAKAGGAEDIAPKIHLIKAAELTVGENGSGISWYEEAEEVAYTDAVEVVNEQRTTILRYTFLYDGKEKMAAEAEGVQYPSVQAAVNAQAGNSSNVVITMLRDSRECVTIPASGTDAVSQTVVTLELAGYVLYGAGGSVITVDEGANLTIRDSSEAGTGKITGGIGNRRPGQSETDGNRFGGGIQVNGTAILESGSVTGNTASNSFFGAGVYVSKTGDFLMEGGRIEKNSGRGVVVNYREGGNGSFRITGGEITGNQGGVYIDSSGAVFVMEGGAISSNTQAWHGVGVYLRNGSGTMTGGTISDNKGTQTHWGGGIFLESASFTMTGGSIENNSILGVGGGIGVQQGQLTLTGGTIRGNTADQNGGGIYVNGNATVIIGEENSSGDVLITDNWARNGNGGGICHMNSKSFSVNGGQVYGNECDMPAKDIYSASGKSIVLLKAADMGHSSYNCWLDGSEETDLLYITEKISEESALHTYQLTAAYRTDPNEDAVARIGSSTYSCLQDAVDAGNAGDIIYLLRDCTDSAIIKNRKNVTVDLNGYTLTTGGTAAFYVSGSLILQDNRDQMDSKADGSGGVLTMNQERTKGRAIVVYAGGSATLAGGTIRGFRGMDFGGAALVRAGGSFNISGGIMTENTADYGGAVCLYGKKATVSSGFTMNGGTMRGNEADYGGAVCLYADYAESSLNFTMIDGVMENNTAGSGGAVCVLNTNSRNVAHTFSLTGGVLRNNTASSGNGGAISYTGGGTSGTNHDLAEIQLTDVEISQNTAKGSGGGVYIAGICTFGMEGILLEGNQSGSSGGISCSTNSAESASVTINSGIVRGNVSLTGNTGGAYFNSKSIIINDITVEDNYAKAVSSYGGGLFLSGPTEFRKGIIKGNRAYHGGGVYASTPSETAFTMGAEVQIAGNRAQGCGGGMVLAGNGIFTLQGVIEKNRSGDFGGGISNQWGVWNYGRSIILDGARISDNETVNGGGLGFRDGGGSLTVTGNTEIVRNKATSSGGGICTTVGISVIVSGGTIEENTAVHGGGIYKSFGKLDISGGTIAKNTATNGGGIWAGGLNNYQYETSGLRCHVLISGGEIIENQASTSGGGICNSTFSDDVVMSGGVIRNNKAGTYGGGVYNTSQKSFFDLQGGQIFDNTAGRGQDVCTYYDTNNHKNGYDSELTLIAAAEMFAETDAQKGIGWYDEINGRVLPDAVAYTPVLRVQALTLKYLTGKTVAKIGTDEYGTVQEAVDAIEQGKYPDMEEPVILMVDNTREMVTVPGGVRAVLNLNGHQIKGLTTAIVSYGSLIIRDEKTEDSPGEGVGRIIGDAYTVAGGIRVCSGGYVKLESGQIADCTASRANTSSIEYGGAGVYVDYGTFEMAGGSISDCVGSYGAAVYVRSGSSTFLMTGGVIEKNRAYQGGSVLVRGGIFRMTGGSIRDNKANSGGGIYVSSGKVQLYGGAVSENTAGITGGGIYLGSGSLRLKNVEIIGNSVTSAISTNYQDMRGSGGGIYQHGGYLYIYDGATLEENTARRGGGIYEYTGTVQMIGGKICGNTADRGGGVAQYSLTGSNFTLSGGEICDNDSSAVMWGNDIYSMYEGSGDYSTVKKENKPKMTLIPAVYMENPDYNVWRDDSYTGDILEAEIIEQGRYITAEIVESNNLQLTAACYGGIGKEEYSTYKEVQSLVIKNLEGADGQLDGTADFDTTVAEKEKTAKDLLDAGQAVLSEETYILNDDTEPLQKILYNGKTYEQAQAVEWAAGNDSAENNNIVRTYDSVTYTMTTTINMAENSAADDTTAAVEEPDMLRLWLEAELPCSAEEAEFSSHGLKYYYMDEKEREDGSTVQLLRGYWEISNEGQAQTVEKSLSIKVYAMKNGDTIKPIFRQWIEGNPDNERTPVERAARILTISAAPRYNVTLQRNTDLAYTGYFNLETGEEASKEEINAYDAAVNAGEPTDPRIVQGTMLGYGVTLSLYNDFSPERRTQNLKGIELPEGPLSFDVTLGGSLYMNGVRITDENGNPLTAAPVVWAYKENTDSAYGSDINNTSFGFNMDWNDEDDITRTTSYAWDGAPFNSGGGSTGCYSGGNWKAGPGGTDEGKKRVTIHFTVDGYSFDNGGGPSRTSNNVDSSLFSPAQIKAFSAGYFQVIYPVDMKAVNEYQDRNQISTAYVEINMEGMASSLEAKSASGQEPVSTQTKGIDVMQEYYGAEYEKYATDEMNYVDNYIKHSSGLYNFRGGSGDGDMLRKTNYFNTSVDYPLSGEGGTGSTPIGTQVYIGADVIFSSRSFDTTDVNSPHYNPDYNEQVDNRIEYNYMTAMNLLQKFDADAYTPVEGTAAVINQRFEPRSQYCSVEKGAFTIRNTETATQWSQTQPYKTQSYNLTVLYAAKPDGSNWTKQEVNPDGTLWTGTAGKAEHSDGGAGEMDQYTEENLIYFTTLKELQDYFGYGEDGTPQGKCVAILYQFRNCCIRTARSLSVHSKMDVTDEFEKTGDTYCTTNDARCWSTYRPTYKAAYRDGTLNKVTQQFNWAYGDGDGDGNGDEPTIYAERNGVTAYGQGSSDITTEVNQRAWSNDAYCKINMPDAADNAVKQMTELYFNGYRKTQYEKGSKVNGTHNGWYSGSSLLLYTMQSSIFIENTDKVRGGNGIRTDYNISQGDRTANFQVTPRIQISSAVKDNELVVNGSQSTEVEIALTLPNYLHYSAGSLEFDYSAAGCTYVEGDLAWTVEVQENTDGTTTLKLKTYVSDISKGLPEIHYSCTIGSPENPETDIPKGSTTLTTTAKINTTYEEINRITCAANFDQTSIRAVRDNDDLIWKETEKNLTELGEELVYALNYSNATESDASPEFLDVLPYNGDGRATAFHGGYRVTGLELTFHSQTSYAQYLSDGGLKTKQHLVRPDNLKTTEQENLLDEARAAAADDDSGWTVHTLQTQTFDEEMNIGTVTYDLTGVDLYQYADAADGIGVFLKFPVVKGKEAVKARIILSPVEKIDNSLITSKGQQQTGNDVYWNDFIYRSSNAIPVVSGDVFVRTVDRTISGLAWMDQNQDGIYTIGSGAFTSSDRLLKGIPVFLYTRTEAPLESAVTQKKLVKNEDGSWSPVKADGTVDINIKYKTVTVNGVTYYPAVDVLGNLVDSVDTDNRGGYAFRNLAAGSYFVFFRDTDGYQVANTINASRASQYVNAVVPFSNLSVTPQRDTGVYQKPTQTTDKAVPDYNGAADSAEGPAPLYRAVIGNGGEGIVLPELEMIQMGHYITNRWNLGLYYIDLTLEKQWLNTRSVPEGNSVELTVSANIGETVSYTALSGKMTQGSEWNNVSLEASGKGVPTVSAAAAKVTQGTDNMSIFWTVPSLALQAQGAGTVGNGAEIKYHFTEAAKDGNGNSIPGYVTELDEFTAQSQKVTFTARNKQILYNIAVTKLRTADKDGNSPEVAGAQYSIYLDENCTNPVSSAITGVQTSNTNGLLTFRNLEADTYFIKETKAPTGYTLSKAVFKVEIKYEEAVNQTPVITVTQIRDAKTGENMSEPVADMDIQKNDAESIPLDYTIAFSAEDECRTNLKLEKVSAKDVTEKLNGAVFTLEKLVPDENGTITAGTQKYLVDTGFAKLEKTTAGVTVNGDGSEISLGLADFGILDPGVYRLTETKAPAGYSLLKEAVLLELHGDGSCTLAGESQSMGQTQSVNGINTVTICVTNQKNFELPATGSWSRYIMLFAGMMLAGGAALLYLLQKKKKA